MPDPDNRETLVLQGENHAALATPAINVADVLKAAVAGGVTAENVSVVKELVALQERMEMRGAEKAFARAFNALQSEMPRIVAKKEVPDRDGNTKFKFAPYEEIMTQVRPLLLKHGFTVSFSMLAEEMRVTSTCTLMHIDGHSKSNSFTARIGKGPPGASDTQADGAASTYAKRFALCNALNITIEQDTDGAPDYPHQVRRALPRHDPHDASILADMRRRVREGFLFGIGVGLFIGGSLMGLIFISTR